MSIKSCKHLKQLDCAFPTDIRDTVGVASVIYFTGLNRQYVGTWFPWFQGHPLISGAMPLKSGAGFA